MPVCALLSIRLLVLSMIIEREQQQATNYKTKL